MEDLFARVLLERQWDCLLPEWLRLVKIVKIITSRILLTLLQDRLAGRSIHLPDTDSGA